MQDLSGRRAAIGVIGSALVTLLSGCGGDDAGAAASAGTSSSSTTDALEGSSSSLCSATPEGEIGPYFADDSDRAFERSEIVANTDGTNVQPGIPFALSLTILDSEDSCMPMEGVQVDIWHCNASGIYSDIANEGTASQTWLRGYQISDDNGVVTFMTIIPGWYSRRTTHIHLRLRSKYSEASSSTDGTNTTQLFFPQELVNMLSSSVTPYSGEGANPTTNADDRVYAQQTHGETLMAPTGNLSEGYSAGLTIGLPITVIAS